MSSRLIEILSLGVNYGSIEALRDVNLTISSSDFIGIIGPNGGGKTTLIKALLKLVKPTFGEVKYLKKDIRIGYLPQHKTLDTLFPISVIDTILSGLQSRNIFSRPSKSDRQRALDIAIENGIAELANRQIGELSGGQLQRVLLSRALISEPELLILDEPTTFVDSKFESDFYDLLKRLSSKIAIVIVSHDIGTICSYVRSIACINKGLHYHPTNDVTEELLSHYDCPIELVAHGAVAHRILPNHK